MFNWPRLARWIDHDREEMAFLAEAGQSAALWEARGCRDEEVWQGDALRDALRRAESVPALPDGVQRFLATGVALRQRQTRRKQLLAAGVVLAVVATMLFLALQVRVARTQRARAEQQRAEVQLEGARAALLQDDQLEARAKLRSAMQTADSPLARTLWWQLQHDHQLWTKQLGSVVYNLAFSPDGETIAAACQDATIHLIDSRTCAMRVLRGHEDQAYAVAFSPDGRQLVSGTISGQLGLWDLSDKSVQFRDTGAPIVRDVTFSPDGRQVAAACEDNRVRIWDLDGDGELRVLEGHTSIVRAVDYNPAGTVLASTGTDHKLRLWDPDTGQALRVIAAHKLDTLGLDFSPDGQAVATASYDGDIHIWDALGGERLRSFRSEGAGRFLRSVQFSPDGSQLVLTSADHGVRLLDAVTGEELRRFEGHTEDVRAAVFSPDGRTLASGGPDGTVRLWDLNTDIRRPVNRGHLSAVYDVAFHPDGATLASGSADGTVRLWDAVSGEQLRVIEGHDSTVEGVDFSPDGSLLASASYDQTIRLWDAASGSIVRALRGHTGAAWSVLFSPDGSRLASADIATSVRLWDVATGTQLLSLAGSAHRGGISFSPDGTTLATGRSGSHIYLWDALTGEERRVLSCGPSYNRYHVRYGPSGRFLASHSPDALVLWDLQEDDCRVIGDHEARINAIDYHPDGHRIGVASSSGEAFVHDLNDGTVTPVEGHNAELNRVRFSPRGELLATSSDDGTVRLWHADSGIPYWHTSALLPSPPEVLTHRGWERPGEMGDGADPRGASAGAAWRRSLEAQARTASLSEDGRLLCQQTHGGALELWDPAADTKLQTLSLPGLTRILAVPDGCVALTAAGALRLARSDGSVHSMADGVTAIAWDRGELLYAAERLILADDLSGGSQVSYPADVGVTAMARTGSWIVAGYREGVIEAVPLSPDPQRRSFSFDDVPSSRVMRILPGPGNTVIAGYANGLLGLWSLDDGMCLYEERLHGPVTFLQIVDGELHAATELGDHLALDLGIFDEDYCELMQAVWREIPAVWEDGGPQAKPIPSGHVCTP